MAKSHHNRFKQAWQKSKNYEAGHGINSITKQCSEQVINMLQELIIAKQDIHESTQSIDQKSLTDHKPKRIRKYDGTHVNMASYITDSYMAETEL